MTPKFYSLGLGQRCEHQRQIFISIFLFPVLPFPFLFCAVFFISKFKIPKCSVLCMYSFNSCSQQQTMSVIAGVIHCSLWRQNRASVGGNRFESIHPWVGRLAITFTTFIAASIKQGNDAVTSLGYNRIKWVNSSEALNQGCLAQSWPCMHWTPTLQRSCGD